MITDIQIQKLTNVVAQDTEVKKVYLFGSYATKSNNEDSDIDLLVVVANDLTKEERRGTIARFGLKTATPDLFFPKDFKVYSMNEFEKLRNDKQSFLGQVLKHSKLLYAG